MLKKFCFILVSCFLLLASPSKALDPIIIRRSIFSPPPSQQPPTKDVDYYSNDIEQFNVTCKAPVTISETFQPRCIENPLTKTRVCIPYTVTEIKGSVSFGLNNYLNLWYRDTFNHFASRPKSIDNYGFSRSMLTFDLNSTYGANNANTRSTPSKLLTCLKGQRLVKAIRSLENKDSKNYQATSNEAVAWTDGKTYIEQQTRPGLKPVRLVDIAIAMANLPFLDPNTCEPDPEEKNVYYEPNIACNPDSQPIPFPGIKGTYDKTGIDPIKACDYLKKSVQVGDIGSNDRIIRIVDDSDETPLQRDSSIPLGNLSTNKDIAQILLVGNQPVPPIDICDTTTAQPESQDKPNSATFQLIGRESPFGIVYDTPQTFQKTFTRTYKVDSRIPKTFATYKAALNNFIPAETQLEFGTQEYPPSAEDKKKTFDPGNNIVEQVFKKLVWPANSI